jgi:hypothetical protein
MVYIHGGSFRIGSAQEFWPNYLLEKDIVLVVPQYRLGPLGELSPIFTLKKPVNRDQELGFKYGPVLKFLLNKKRPRNTGRVCTNSSSN